MRKGVKLKSNITKNEINTCKRGNNLGKDYFSNLENKTIFLETLFHKLNLKTLEDWLSLSSKQLSYHGTKNLFKTSKDIKKTIQKVYPNYPWNTYENSLRFNTIEKQKKFMDELYIKLNLKSLNDWLKISKLALYEKGAKSLIQHYYSHNFHKLLSTIYPNHLWNFDNNNSKNHSIKYFQSIIENQRQFMGNLFLKLKLKSLEDWILISRKRIKSLAGGSIILSLYDNDMKKLLPSIYPYYPWKFDFLLSNIRSKEYLSSINNQIIIMERLYYKFQLRSLDEWTEISLNYLKKNGGSFLLKFYSNNQKKMLQKIYPNFPWYFSSKVTPNLLFKSIDFQKKFLDYLFVKLKLKSKDDFIFITKNKIIQYGGRSLLLLYDNNIQKMLKNIYPDHDWNFSIADLSLIDNQRKLMQKIFKDLNLEKNDDWLKVSRYQLLLHGGRKLLQIYGNDWKLILKEIYPKHDWNFSSLKFRPNATYFKSSLSFNIEKLKQLKKIYSIEEKKDWYRLPSHFEEIDVFHSLSLVYPNEKWHWDIFNTRSKKSNQRLLFSFLHQIYSSSLLIENYRHPHISQSFSKIPMEFDVFIPSLSLAFEYQGSQHYEDHPIGFGHLEIYQTRDIFKERLASSQNIRIVQIPYWWDQSFSSLLSSIDNPYHNPSFSSSL